MAIRTTVSVNQDDLDRLAESMKNHDPDAFDDITDDKSMHEFLEDYFGDDKYKDIVSNTYREKKLMQFITFKQSKGKDLGQDKKQDAKTIYPNTAAGRDKYRRRGSRKSDLSGLDTRDGRTVDVKDAKKKKRPSRPKIRREYTDFGTTKGGKIVKVRPITVQMKDGRIIRRYIDSQGRFAKKKVKK